MTTKKMSIIQSFLDWFLSNPNPFVVLLKGLVVIGAIILLCFGIFSLVTSLINMFKIFGIIPFE